MRTTISYITFSHSVEVSQLRKPDVLWEVIAFCAKFQESYCAHSVCSFEGRGLICRS